MHRLIMAFAALAFVFSTVLVARPGFAEGDDSGAADAADAADAAAANANNPLANMIAFNIQNYYVAELYGTDESSNTAWLRYAQPFGKWLMRASLPISTVPVGGGQDPVSGLGDFNVFFAYLLSDPSSPKQFGIGPLLAAPTATDDVLGSDVWQAGAAAVYFNASSPVVQRSACQGNQRPLAELFSKTHHLLPEPCVKGPRRWDASDTHRLTAAGRLSSGEAK